jgi:tetratricopeptide (TPR) repeat protein
MDRRADGVLAAADDRLVHGTIKEFGTPAAASAAFSDRGVRYYLENDYIQAMFRFNQAWLIDSTNPESYYGFAIVYTDHGNHAEAHRWIQEALNRDLSLCVSLADAALIEARYLGYNPDLTEAERSEIRAEIDRLLDRAKETSFGDQRDYVETTGAEALEILRRAGS